MSATVDIQTKKAANAFSVPIQSVTTRDTTEKSVMKKNESNEEMEDVDNIKVTDSKDKKVVEEKKDIECVFVVEGNTVKLTPVTTGIQDNSYIEIKSGLNEGQEVISAPYNLIARMLKNGDAIEKVKKEQLYSKEKK